MTRINLGPTQRELLCLLADTPGSTWSTTAGWRCGSHTNTETILASLVKYDLVERTGDSPDRYGIFCITDLGRAKGKALRRPR